MKSEYYSNLAYVYLTDQKTNKTQDLCHKAIELDAKNKSAFYFRGISFLWEGQYEKAIADAESVISLDSDFINGYILKSDALLYSFGQEWTKVYKKSNQERFAEKTLPFIEQASQTLESCLNRCANGKTNPDLNYKLRAVKAFYRTISYKADPDSLSVSADPKPGIKSVVLHTKPRASYTTRARIGNVQGIIVVAVEFAADGTIKNPMILKGLAGGLNEEVLKVVKKIKFSPAEENGVPVSKIKLIQYSFSIY